jgi:hypothetical protein
MPNVNRLAPATRAAGGAVVWIQNTITPETEKSWSSGSAICPRGMGAAHAPGLHPRRFWPCNMLTVERTIGETAASNCDLSSKIRPRVKTTASALKSVPS